MYSFILFVEQLLTRMGVFLQSLAMNLGGPGIMLIAIGDSSFLSLPEGNDILIVILSIGSSWGLMAYYVGMTTLGSVIGCILLYTLGRKGGRLLLKRRFSERKVEQAERIYEKYGVLTVAIASILPPPAPFKIFVLSAGVFNLRLIHFVGAVVFGRTLRYSTLGILAVLYGNSLKTFMQRNLDKIGIILLGCLVIIVAVIVIFQMLRMRDKRYN